VSEALPDAPAVAVAVDVAVFTVLTGRPHVLLVRPRAGAFAGQWALPGGRVRAEESLDDAARRELEAQSGLRNIYLEQLYTFGSPQRDPQGRVVSVAYVALIHGGRLRRRTARDAERHEGSGDKYADATWAPVSRLPALGYDHRTVARTALARLRAKLEYTNLVYTLLPAAFTLGELQEMYEAILGRTLDRRNFRKKVLALGLLRPLGRMRRGAHRPAALYAFHHRRPMNVTMT
jgi:ADP-ribose pyrophosphatase YjhB (NUDIX family)